MQFGKPFSFVFEDPDWLKKLALLALLGFAQLIPVIGSIFMALVYSGVMIDVMRKVINKDLPTIPNLEIGRQLSDGFKVWVIGVVYALPGIAVGLLMALVSIIGGVGSFWGANNNNGGAAGVIGVVMILVMVCMGLIMAVYFVLVGFVAPAYLGRFIQYGTISSALNFREVFKTAFKKPVPYLLAILGVFLVGAVGGIAGSILSSIGAIALGVGALFGMAVATVWMSLASGHYYAQAYNESIEEAI